MAQQQIRLVSSLADVHQVLQDLNINDVNQVGQVRFELDERTSLKEAAKIDRRARPGRLGFQLVNPELLECKTSTKIALEESFDIMLDASVRRFDQELHAVEGSIGTLKALMLTTDDQLPHNGPPLEQRNQGVQHVIYPNPPFPHFPEFEHGNQNTRVNYQPPFNVQADLDRAAARDRRAQRALWRAKLRFLEARHSILKDMKLEMLSRMRAEYREIMEEPSDLGAGYVVDGDPPLV